MPDRELAEIAARQHGLITRPQALAELTPDQVAHRLRSRRWLPVFDRVYRLAGTPATWRQALLAACLAAPGAVASHRAAAAVWGLPGVAPGHVEVVVAAGRRVRLAGVTVHESTLLDPRFVTCVDAIPVTTPARTLVDLSAVVHPFVVERAADHALRRRLLTLSEWHDCFGAMAKRGRRRVAWLRPVLDARPRWTAGAESGGEAALARLLVDAGLPRPVHQHQVVAGPTVFLLDLAYPEHKVAIEYDGWPVHATRSAFDRDRARDNLLLVQGWVVLRFTSTSPPDQVVATVRAALAAASSPVTSRRRAAHGASA